MNNLQFYPCIENPLTGHINKRVGPAMTREQAEDLLKRRYPSKWLRCEVIPQPVNMPRGFVS